jgi:hypothetical protein
MAGDSPETFGGIRFEAIIVGQNENVDSASGDPPCQPICSGSRARLAKRYLLPFGTVTITFFVVEFPDASIAWTAIV